MKSTRKFLEDQAAEREHERDEFTQEIEKLRSQLRDRDKEKTVNDRREKEVREGFKEGATFCMLLLFVFVGAEHNSLHKKTF